MNIKEKFEGVLLMILFGILSYALIRTVIFLQRAILLLNHNNSILYTSSNKGFMILEFLSIFILFTFAVGLLYERYLSKKAKKNSKQSKAKKSYKQSSDFKESDKFLKRATLIILFTILICGRCFTIITPDKIYYSSLDTLFLTKSYDYSEVKSIDIKSYKSRKSGSTLEYNISFENHNVNLMNSLDKDKDIKINKVHRSITKNSIDVVMKENLEYKAKKILDRVSILTDLN